MNIKDIKIWMIILFMFLFVATGFIGSLGIYANFRIYKVWCLRDSFHPELFEVESIKYTGSADEASYKIAVGKIDGKKITYRVGEPKEMIGIGSKIPVWYANKYPALINRNSEDVVFDFSEYHRMIWINLLMPLPFLLILFVYEKFKKHVKAEMDN